MSDQLAPSPLTKSSRAGMLVTNVPMNNQPKIRPVRWTSTDNVRSLLSADAASRSAADHPYTMPDAAPATERQTSQRRPVAARPLVTRGEAVMSQDSKAIVRRFDQECWGQARCRWLTRSSLAQRRLPIRTRP